MKKENELAILKMAAKPFDSCDHICACIMTGKDGENPTLFVERDFLTKVTLTFTAKDILQMSQQYDGDTFAAILKKTQEASSKKYKEELKEVFGE